MKLRSSRIINIEQTLIEYGRLKLELQTLDDRIKTLFNHQYEDEESQLSEYFNYCKSFRENKDIFNRDGYYEMYDIEEWAKEWGQEFDNKPHLKEVTKASYELIELIKRRQQVRFELRYKKASITKYSIKAYKTINE